MDIVTHQGTHAASSGLKQPYHLVNPSPWPIIGAFGGGLLLAGVVFAAHYGNYLMLGAGVATVALVMAMWWRDVLTESSTPGLHSPVVRLGLRYGMTLFIMSEVMFFVGVFWAFFHFALYPEHVAGAVGVASWPPAGVHTFDAFRIPLLNTMILLLSGCTVTWAHHSLIENDRKSLIFALGLTILLGMSFTTLQAVEYSEAPFHLSGGIYPSVFFLATGFHGFHVIVGTIFLGICWLRAKSGGFTSTQHFGFEAAAWYWHFVDVVWLFLFFFVYIWGAGVPIAE